MSSETGTIGSQLSVATGTQVLYSGSSMASPIAQLPASAYDGLIVVSSKPPREVARLVEEAGGDPSSVGHVPISGAEYAYDGPMWTSEPLVPDDLTGLSMRLSRAFEALGDGWLLVENLNVFLLYAAEDRVIRFFDHVTRLAADYGITGVYSLVPDAVPAETCDRLKHGVDEVYVDR
jgi:hypothetical protein